MLVVVLVLEVADILPLDQRNKIVAGNRALLKARKSTESRTRTTTRTRTIAKFRDLGLARLERSGSGNFGYEAGGALGCRDDSEPELRPGKTDKNSCVEQDIPYVHDSLKICQRPTTLI